MTETAASYRVRRVGHKGADLIAPGNTLASFDAALAAGVDMIEFDVLPEDVDDRAGSRLILAHDYKAPAWGNPLTLEEGLAHLSSIGFDGIDLDVDLKLPGYEERVAAALADAGASERALVSSQYPESLAVLRASAPELRLGWSIPRVARDYTKSLFTALPAYVAIQAYRRWIPSRAAAEIHAGRCDAVMANRLVVSRGLVKAVEDAGGELYVWTVDDPGQIRALTELGVTGVITNDPRLFDRA